jgi:DNA-binding FadR family transcriptional regulator
MAALTDPPRVYKRVDTLMLQLQHRMLVTGLAPGDPLASEMDLLQRYEVGRGVLREAIRALERHGFVRTVEGRHGGLKVGEPTQGQTVRTAVLYFTFLKLATEDLQELAQAMEMAALKLCVRADHNPAALERLQKALDPSADTDAKSLRALGRHYYRGLAATTNNPLFQLMMGILGSLYTMGDDKTSTGDPQIRTAWLDAARAVVSALGRGDFDSALMHHQQLRGKGKLFRFRRRSIDELFATPRSQPTRVNP